MSNVLKFERKKDFWEHKYEKMQIMQLLEEMIKFNDAKLASKNMDISLINRGIVLFKYIESLSQTPGMRALASSYRKHLEHEKLSVRTI